MLKKTKSEPKKRVIEFLEQTRAQRDVDFTFKVSGNMADAEKFLHRMRVELSRMRALVQRKGMVPATFKMLLVSIHVNKGGTCSVTIRKSYSKNDVTEEINNIFDAISAGKMINV